MTHGHESTIHDHDGQGAGIWSDSAAVEIVGPVDRAFDELVIVSARASLADHYVVPSGSMEPTVQVGDRILVNKAAFGLRVPLTQLWLGAPSGAA